MNGQDIRRISLRKLRSQLSIVPQETYLFQGTLKENIAYGNQDATEEQIIRAASMAEAHDFITGLRDGYAMRIGASGSGLSLGQRQRIGLARAFLKDSPILILDEGLNSIDDPIRIKIIDNMAELAKRKVVLVITHDLQPLEKCQKVFAIIEGTVREIGDKDSIYESSEYIKYLKLKIKYGRCPADSSARKVGS